MISGILPKFVHALAIYNRSRRSGGIMESENIVTIQFKFTRDKALFLMALFFLCWHPKPLNSETLTLTTYYPAPYGGYVGLLTTGTGGVNTLLARDGGNVGIGMANPGVKLEVAQNATLKVGQAYLSSGGDYVHLSNNEWYNGGAWNASGAGTLLQLTGQSMNVYRHDAGGNHVGEMSLDGSGNLNLNGGGNLNMAGNGTITGVCRIIGYSFGGVTSCAWNERVFGYFGDGGVRMWGWIPYIGVWVGQDQSNVQSGNIMGFGQDWGGSMQCCRIQ